ncbi:MAG: ribose 5-phosphate isomerase [Patescibacteria group bacterium]|jgi:ribose 5-phosphate isomerase B|nr:ribose 5-phosphate isomerase [Patescibacteria group bacterium]
MKIHIATDHAGFEHKESLKAYLLSKGYEVIDHGAKELNEGDDYPGFISSAAKAVIADPESKAIVFGGSGEGEAMVANRFKGARAAVYYGGNKDILVFSRAHNDANILSLGARFLVEEEVNEAADIWLQTEFSGDERHVRRLAQF